MLEREANNTIFMKVSLKSQKNQIADADCMYKHRRHANNESIG
ncbi:MAG TPA: hypothetical protein VKA95_13720 [Nitrososphaeraceae archaeon]|jgi:hypothetical protein|nr:hypothetical protein [Nitrososphaeraceae archaeon]